MGNRSRFVAVSVSAAAAGVAIARRRARWRRVAEGIQETILPTAAHAVVEGGRDDEAHAPGHRHLPVNGGARPGPQRLRSRPWMKHDHGLRQSGTG